MNQSRRDFLKNAAILSGAAGLYNMLPFSIQKAMAINADKGTTFYDAEHIVFLMQENRSFDHMFGTLKGVRGFGDPRAKSLPDGNKVWIQKDKQGQPHAPFHIDINKTKVTWQGGLPHSWRDQIGPRNYGKYDKWVPFKSAMTMGYYDRSDVPFYYAMADAFTVCDHYFCSSLTGTTPNRLFFWTGNIRPAPTGEGTPAVYNSLAESRDNHYVDWSSFPDLLEDHGVSWRVYQNEIWTANLPGETDYWLGNYGDNALEYIRRNHVKLAPYFRKNGDKTGKQHLSAEEVTARYHQLSQREKDIVDKMFTGNIDVEDYLKLTPFTFKDDQGEEHTVNVPKEDIFHQFRSDVQSGKLPTVSWLVAPQAFSDHTSTPLYGTWYVSEALDILTKNPEVWKKTIFILNYDENDGYFDHLPPFTPPNPYDKATGKTTYGMDTASDFHKEDDSPVGLGYRVPCIIASPWSKGGFVNSQIFDHTSTLMFLENFLSKKTGKKIQSPNISSWRRHICGDMTSAFRPYNGEEVPLPDFEVRSEVIRNIQSAKNKPKQVVPEPLSGQEITAVNQGLTVQEKGTKPACALPYLPKAEIALDKQTGVLQLQLEAIALDAQTGIPFNVYTPTAYGDDRGKNWDYAVAAGKTLEDELKLDLFEDQRYDLCIHGPNGFFRRFVGNLKDPDIQTSCVYERKASLKKAFTGNIDLLVENLGSRAAVVTLTDNAYGRASQQITVQAGGKKEIKMNLSSSGGWYDFTLRADGNAVFERHYAGHVETGEVSISDPAMGGVFNR